MTPQKWVSLSKAEEGKEYLAVLSVLPLKKFFAIPLIIKNSSPIRNQLRETKGVLGFSFKIELLKKTVYTLSAWESKQSLMDFVNKLPHSEIMSLLTPYMNKSRFVYWNVKLPGIPPSWEQAFVLLKETS